jgi:hypothetical protein
MRLVTHIVFGSLQGLMMLGAVDFALAGSPPESCLSAASAASDADAITVNTVSLSGTVRCTAEEQFQDELKKRIWLAFVARVRPRLLQRYSNDVQRFAWATWSTPIRVRVTRCPRPTGTPVASADCVPSIGLEQSGDNDIVDLAALEAVDVALAAGISWCDLGSYDLSVRFEPSRASDRTRVGPVVCLLLRSESPEIRVRAAESLGSMGRHVAKRALDGLRQAESDPDPRVQQAVRAAEEEIKNRAKQGRPKGSAQRPN